MSLTYRKDKYGKDELVDTRGGQVMMEWEKEYMMECINYLQPQGDVLEIGFGFGYSATKIMTYNPNSYTIIECEDNVIEKIEEWKKGYPNAKITIVKGEWQNVINTLGTFDSIFFDDFPINRELNIEDFHRMKLFCHKVLTHNTRLGSAISFYCQNAFNTFDHCVQLSMKLFSCEIPDNCKYCHGKQMFLVKLTKIAEIKEDNLFIKEYNYWKNNAKFVLRKIYKEKLCFTIMDNFLDNPETYRTNALQHIYKQTSEGSMCTTEVDKVVLQKLYEKFPLAKVDPPLQASSSFCYYTSLNSLPIKATQARLGFILFLTPNAPLKSGIKFYMYKNNTRYEEVEEKYKSLNIPRFTKDFTKWHVVDSIGNVFNRLVFFDPRHYHTIQNLFGDNKNNSLFMQWIYFN